MHICGTKGRWVNEFRSSLIPLTHWGVVTHICVSKLSIIGSDNGLSPGWRQAIIWTNAGILLIRPLGINFSEIWIGIQTFSINEIQLKNIVCEMASILALPQWVKRGQYIRNECITARLIKRYHCRQGVAGNYLLVLLQITQSNDAVIK